MKAWRTGGVMEETNGVTVFSLAPLRSLGQGRGRTMGWTQVIAAMQIYMRHWTGHGRWWSLLWSARLKYTSVKGDLPGFSSRPAPRPHGCQSLGPLHLLLLLDSLGRTCNFEFSKPKVLHSLCWLHVCWVVPALHPCRNAEISGYNLDQTEK